MAYLSDAELLDTEGGFTRWDDKIGAGSVEETLEQALAEERLAELESELEQDHENLRGDVPLEYQAVPEPKLIPRWMNTPAYWELIYLCFLFRPGRFCPLCKSRFRPYPYKIRLSYFPWKVVCKGRHCPPLKTSCQGERYSPLDSLCQQGCYSRPYWMT